MQMPLAASVSFSGNDCSKWLLNIVQTINTYTMSQWPCFPTVHVWARVQQSKIQYTGVHSVGGIYEPVRSAI